METNSTGRVSPGGTRLYNAAGVLLYAAAVISVLVFILWPVVAILVESMRVGDQFSFHNYLQLFTENRQILLNSICISTASTVLSVCIGLFVALFITHSGNRGKKVVFTTLLLSMISPPFVTALSYIMLFGRRGIITYQLLGLHWNPYGWHGVLLMQSIGHASLAALIITGVLRGINKNLEEASLDLGAGSMATLLKVTIPLARPGIIAAALLAFILSLADFGTPVIIGGNFTVLATEAYLSVIGLYNLPRASAMGVLLLIPALVMFVIYRRVMRRSQYFSLQTGGDSQLKLAPAVNIVLAIVTWAFISFQILQYGTIFWGAFAKTWGVDFSPVLYHIRAIGTGEWQSLWRSIEYAMIAAISGSFLGVLISYMVERKKYAGSKILDFLATLPFMIPGPFLGIAYVLAFHQGPLVLTGTVFIVIVNCIYRQLPIGTKAGTAVLSQLNPETEYAARDLGASEIHVFKDVALPAMKPAFLISFINTFTATMTTIGAIIFLVTPGARVATVEMFDAIKTGDIGQGAVLANLIILVTLLVNLGFSYLLLRTKDVGVSVKGENRYVTAIETLKQSV